MDKEQLLQEILSGGIIAILRVRNSEKVIAAARAIADGGIRAIEISMNTPGALNLLPGLAQLDGVIPGIGTVTDAETAKAAIEAGAQFVVSPITKKDIIDTCHDHGKPVFSGAFTPGEVFNTWESGADVVKIFPTGTLGMAYIKSLKAPFPHIRLMPTGGVTPENIDRWFDVGASCVGVGSSFTRGEIIDNEEWGRITAIACEMITNVSHFRDNGLNK